MDYSKNSVDTKIDVNENIENNNTMIQVWLKKALSFIEKDEKENIISSCL